jgi:hypothetical protein
MKRSDSRGLPVSPSNLAALEHYELAVQHVFEMQGRIHDGTEWLNATSPNWAGTALAFHFSPGSVRLRRPPRAALL